MSAEDRMNITWERLHLATAELARSGSIKERLVDAYLNHLSTLAESELPRELREDFTDMTRAFNRVRPLPGEDAVHASIRKMSSEDADRYASRIVAMLGTVARYQMNGRSPQAAVLQLYAAEA
jgi:hypothetical protein